MGAAEPPPAPGRGGVHLILRKLVATFNSEKTELMHFSKRIMSSEESDVTFNGTAIIKTESCKFLGVLLDSDMKFRSHIDMVTVKLSKNAGLLYRLKDSLTQSARLSFYYGLIYPFLTYNVIVEGGTNEGHLTKLKVQHKRIIRTLCDAGRFEHTSPLFYSLGLLKFAEIYKFYMGIYMYKAIAEGKFTIEHNLNTRNRNLACPSFQRLSNCQQAISYQGPQVWNSLPECIRKSSSLRVFKADLKRYYLNSYSSQPCIPV